MGRVQPRSIERTKSDVNDVNAKHVKRSVGAKRRPRCVCLAASIVDLCELARVRSDDVLLRARSLKLPLPFVAFASVCASCLDSSTCRKAIAWHLRLTVCSQGLFRCGLFRLVGFKKLRIKIMIVFCQYTCNQIVLFMCFWIFWFFSSGCFGVLFFCISFNWLFFQKNKINEME